ncbi:MAG: hypothetical protein KIT09_08090 [Bryobacteraceae bacterium]|nr:hypothetical protein [Bryobacteraceae bacterium]
MMKKLMLSGLLAAVFAATAPAQLIPSTENVQRGYGPGNGAGNQGSRPQDGSGYGAKGQRKGKNNGTCDNTGPRGQQRGAQNRGRGR